MATSISLPVVLLRHQHYAPEDDDGTILTTADRVWLSAKLRPLVHRDSEHGGYDLAAGGHSDWYLDCRELVYGVDAPFVAQLIDNELASLYFDAIGGVGFGGTPLGLLVAARRQVRSFAVRLDQKGHGRAGKVIGPLLPGDHVVLVEDVFNTGASVCSAVEALRAAGVVVASIICLVNRGNAQLKVLYGDIPFISFLTEADLA